MAKIVTHVIRSPQRQRLVSQVRRAKEEVRQAALEATAQEALDIADDIVDNWQHKPDFKIKTRITSDEIKVSLVPTGENAKYWLWTSEGTKPHIIRAKRAPRLAFRMGGSPKTSSRGPTWGNGQKAEGDWRTPFAVHHPGTEARHFEVYIGKQVKASFKRAVENAFRRAVR